jgi:hypothetical protein
MKTRKILVGAALVALFVRGGFAAPVVLEAESFDNLGGWTLDAQFMEQMGSPYLLAHGLGTPVADATTTFTVAEAGAYDVWVRTKNWTAPWSDAAAGQFQVQVDGAAVEGVGGTCAGADWQWQRLGAVTLAAGAHALALHDLTGFDGRIDQVLISRRDAETQGLLADPVSPALLSKQLCASTPAVALQERSDLVVVGGGVAGICAAVTAARQGLTVALVQDRPVLGGNNSSEVRVHLGGRQNLGPYPRLGDVVAEIGPATGGNAQAASVYEDDRKLAVVAAEPNITLFLNTKVDSVETAEGRIVRVGGVNVRTGARSVFAAPLFVDATGDGTVGALAGADFRIGREAKRETGEASAPETADMMTMGSSVQWYAERGAADFPRQPWMIAFTDENATAALRGDWDWETGIGRDPLADAERIRDYGMLVVYSNWAHVKNAPKTKDKFADKHLAWVASVAGRRESRRLVGDVVLSENDIDGEVYYPDGTCLTSWSVDLHFPRTAEETKYAGEPFRAATVHKKVKAYPIPYRCLYSRNVGNLFMAGRDISVTHAALGTVRVMRTCGMMGEVVGLAAALCKAHGCSPRDVYAAHLDELKAAMAKGAGRGVPQPPQDYNEGFTRGISEKALTPPKRVLMIGNSFSRPVVRTLPKLAKEAGVRLDIASLYIGGCSLERHATNILFNVHAYLVERDNEGVFTKGQGATVGEWLAKEPWDVVTIQQASPLSWRPETYVPWGDQVIAEIRRLAPQAEIVFQETWSYNKKDARLSPGKWGIDQTEMYARIHAAVAAFAEPRGLRVIPTGAAVQAARARGEEPVGSGGDHIHLNRAGEALQTRVWLKALFGVDAATSPR